MITRFRSFWITYKSRSYPYQAQSSGWLVSFRRACVGLALASAGGLGVWASDAAHAAGFDCSKASTLVESLICADPSLSALDDEMSAAWGEARRASPNPNQLLEAQRAFIRQRGQCQNPRCIADIARQRTAELKTISASAVAPGVGQPAAATPRPTPAAPQQGGGAFAGLVPSQAAAAAAAAAAGGGGGGGAAGAPQTTIDGKIVQTVIAEGMGSTIESAVQNAAENALKQVVGTFVDTDTQIERRTQISEGLRSETRNIRHDMREYSQGSIQAFEVLENRIDGTIHRVTAKVAVRVDDFKVYVRKLTEGSISVGQGLFAQLQTIQNNSRNSSSIFSTRIVTPLLGQEVANFEINSPRLLSGISDRDWKILMGPVELSNQRPPEKSQFEESYGKGFVIVAGVRILSLDYYQSMEKTLREISVIKKSLKEIDENSLYGSAEECDLKYQRRRCVILGGEASGEPYRMYVVDDAIGDEKFTGQNFPKTTEQFANMYGFFDPRRPSHSDSFFGDHRNSPPIPRLAPRLLVQLMSEDGVVHETLSPAGCDLRPGTSDGFNICVIKYGVNYRRLGRFHNAVHIKRTDRFIIGMRVPPNEWAKIKSIKLQAVQP